MPSLRPLVKANADEGQMKLVGYALQVKRGEEFKDIGVLYRSLATAEREKAQWERHRPNKEYAIRPVYDNPQKRP